ncbi:hypothetical protein EYF80_026416 [Liparis tanakae]|uniref:Uncharacterized protein n=1 Tax=Liparis tanakae TaxID=230148 RepID=A0A4Z2HEJ2_9TELE|nr:hypothetical protein EYF80_026416 [Liparis tanakae]
MDLKRVTLRLLASSPASPFSARVTGEGTRCSQCGVGERGHPAATGPCPRQTAPQAGPNGSCASSISRTPRRCGWRSGIIKNYGKSFTGHLTI